MTARHKRPRPQRQPDNGPSDRKVLRRVFRMSAGHWPGMVTVFLLDLLSTPLVLLTPVPLALVVDTVIGDNPAPGALRAVLPDDWLVRDSQLLWLAASMIVSIVIISGLRDILRGYVSTRTSEGLTLHTRTTLFRHAQRLSLAYHDRRGTSDSVYRIQYDTSSIAGLTLSGLLPLTMSLVTLVVMLNVIGQLSLSLLLVALAVSPVLFLLSGRYKKRAKRWYRHVKAVESEALGVVTESMSALRVVKAFSREDHEHQRFLERSGYGVAARIRLSVWESAFSTAISVVIAAGTAAVLVVGVRQVQSGELTLGQLLLVYSYLGQLYGPLRELSRRVASLQGAMTSAERVFEVLDILPDVQDPPHPRPLQRLRGEIQLREVSFRYEEGPEVIHSVSLHLAPGTRLGIAGRTGAGKSTLVSLLTRLYDPTSGDVLLDGVDAREYAVKDLRNQFAIVLQEPVLFATSILENISYAREGATQEEVEEAARAADAHDFITAMPDGYQTLVGERGLRLSGGERQRISLARAFLKDAPILVLDEPTSSVDTATEASIMQAMERLMEGRTTLMIAHRLSTLDYCDARIVIDDGRIVSASGTLIVPENQVIDLMVPSRVKGADRRELEPTP